MNTPNGSGGAPRWTRPPLARDRPKRSSGTLYRTADRPGETLGGVPLTSADRAVVAAVRMAYKVAEAQVERSARLAKRLRHAGDEIAGPQSSRQALDGTERLVFRAMMGALAWIEAAIASERGSPLKRLAEAEVQMVASMLGLDTAPRQPAVRARHARRQADAPAPASTAAEPAVSATAPTRELAIVNRSPDRRAVRVVHFEVDSSADGTTAVAFYNVERIASKPLQGELTLTGKRGASLSLSTPRLAPTGLWRAAICNDDGLQLGFIDIVL